MKGHNCILLITLLSFISVLCAKRAELDFEYVVNGKAELMVVKGIDFNGKKLNLVFDTGASGSGLNLETIKELGLVPDTSVVARGAGGDVRVLMFNHRKIQLNDMEINVHLAEFPLPSLNMVNGEKTHGLLGIGSFVGYYLMIDQDRKKLIVSDRKIKIKRDHFAVLKTECRGGKRFIEGTIILKEGKLISGRMVLDSGNTLPMMIRQKNVSDYDFMQDVDSLKAFSVGGIGKNKVKVYPVRIPGLRFGELQMNDVPVFIDNNEIKGFDFIANIGLPILKKMNILFDKDQQKVTFYPNNDFDKPVKEE